MPLAGIRAAGSSQTFQRFRWWYQFPFRRQTFRECQRQWVPWIRWSALRQWRSKPCIYWRGQRFYQGARYLRPLKRRRQWQWTVGLSARSPGAFEVLHVEMLVPVAFGLAEANPVDDRSVVQRIRNHCVLVSCQAFEEAPIRIKAAWIENRILCPVEVAQFLLQVLVDILGPADKSHWSHSASTNIHYFLSCFDRLNNLETNNRTTSLLLAKPR